MMSYPMLTLVSERLILQQTTSLHCTLVLKNMLRNGKFCVAYIDFSKASDTVQHPILWTILLRAGVKGRMIKILKSMYSIIKACVRCGSSCTEYFDCQQGLKQGCLLSPTLFSLFINE